MQVIIIGMGEIGKHLASVLSGEGHDVTIVDSDAEALELAQDRVDARVVRGNGASVPTLRQAEVEGADLVSAVTDNDEVNIVACLQAKNLGAKRVVARVDSHDYLPHWEGTYHDLLGIDLVISPRILAASQIKQLVLSLGAVSVAYFAHDRIEMVQLPLADSSRYNLPLRDLNMPAGTLVGAILRNDELIIPSGNDMLVPHDEIFLIGKAEKIPEAERFFGRALSRVAKNVVILGGGEVGYALARGLEKRDIRVRIIEWNPRQCEFLSEELAEAVIINGDGTDLDLLKEERVGDADVFVAASKRDEINLMSGLVAKELGVKKTIALVHRPTYIDVYEHLGLDATISPRRFAANHILRYVRSGKIVSISDLAGGKGECLEFVVSEKSQVANKKLKDLNFPRGAVVGAIASQRGIFVPTGEDWIRPGDTAIVFSLPQVRSGIEKLFKE